MQWKTAHQNRGWSLITGTWTNTWSFDLKPSRPNYKYIHVLSFSTCAREYCASDQSLVTDRFRIVNPLLFWVSTFGLLCLASLGFPLIQKYFPSLRWSSLLCKQHWCWQSFSIAFFLPYWRCFRACLCYTFDKAGFLFNFSTGSVARTTPLSKGLGILVFMASW